MRNLKLSILMVSIFQVSLISAMGPEVLDTEQFQEPARKYLEQMEKSGILITDLLPIIYEYSGIHENIIEQSNNLANAINRSPKGKIAFEAIKQAVENGAYVNFKYPNGDTPLIRVLKIHRNEEELSPVVKYLIRNGANVNAKDEDGNTPLIIAIENKFQEMVNLLIQAKADLNVKNSKGQTMLIRAAKDGEYELVKFLIYHGADPKIKDNSLNGTTAYDYASYGYVSSRRGGAVKGTPEDYLKIKNLLSPEVEQKRERESAQVKVEVKRPEEDIEWQREPEEDIDLQRALDAIKQQEEQEAKNIIKQKEIQSFYAEQLRRRQEERKREEEEQAQRAQEALAQAAAQPEENWEEEASAEEAEGWGNIEHEE